MSCAPVGPVEELLGVGREADWGVAGAQELALLLEGDGFEVHSRRNKLEVVSSEKAPAHGVARQVTTGIDVTGTFNAILDTANIDYLLSMIDRDATTGKLRAEGWTFIKDKKFEIVSYLGCKIGSCTISASPGEAVRISMDVTAREESVAGSTPGAPSTGAFYMHWASELTIDGGSALVELEDWSVTIENTLEMGPHHFKSAANPEEAIISFLCETQQMISGSFTIVEKDATYRTPIRTDGTNSLEFKVQDGSGTPTNDVSIVVPVAHITDADSTGPGLKRVTVNFVGEFDVNGDIFKLSGVTPPAPLP